jgi:hypothetical protein
MSNEGKPSIVFAHGLWADGSRFQKLIPTLQADGHEVIGSQRPPTILAHRSSPAQIAFSRMQSAVAAHGRSLAVP